MANFPSPSSPDSPLCPGRLVLADGAVFSGRFCGPALPASGEVVFNTGMTGYPETLSDPSYYGQILVMTYPLIGNYGVPAGTAELESDRLQVRGLIMADYSDNWSHWQSRRSLGQWLQDSGMPALTDIDTRSLTRHLRAHGTLPGRIELLPAPASQEASAHGMLDLISELPFGPDLLARVSISEPRLHGQGDKRVLLLDCGAKRGILRALLQSPLEVLQVPWNHDLELPCDGLVISNGPGNPQDYDAVVEVIRRFLSRGLPVLGICLGHQLLARAAGARTERLPFGHRSQNQPVRDLVSGRCYITSQNHGYAVSHDSLPPDWEPWFVNLHDGSNEGLRHRQLPFAGVQFHPEASPGPQDTSFLIADFCQRVLQA